jgi:hypothetical protein
VDELTPLQCFFIGIASAWLGLGALWLLVMKAASDARKRSAGPSPLTGGEVRPEAQVTKALDQRLQAIEDRLSALEAWRRG